MKYIKLFEGYWGSAGAGVLPVSMETKRLLIPLRSSEVLEPNTWGVWGGKIDMGELDQFEETESLDLSIEHAAEREFIEETKYNGSIELIPAYVYRDGGFTYYNFFGIIESEFDPILNWETEDYKWVTLDELRNIKTKHFGLEALLKNNLNELLELVK